MQSRIIRLNQSIMDIALLMTGDIENCVDLFKSNPGIGTFDNLTPGTVVKCADVNNEVTRYYKLNDISLATGYLNDSQLLGLMIVEQNFIPI